MLFKLEHLNNSISKMSNIFSQCSTSTQSADTQQSLGGLSVMDVPYYLTLNNPVHLCRSDPQTDETVAHLVSDALTESKVGFNVIAGIAEWTCSSFSDEAMMQVCFVVRLWRQEGQLLVESTRFSGDAFVYVPLRNTIIKQIISRLPTTTSPD